MAENYWKKLKTQTIFEHPRLTVVEDDVELPHGKQTKYMRYEGLRDYVTVVAVQDDQVLLVRDYSYPHDEWLWQFPEGDTEPNESIERSAQRELEEEAGLHAEQITQIGMNYDHHRRTSRKDYIFLASGLQPLEVTGGDEEEHGITSEWFTIEQVNTMIKEGKILQKNTLAAWPVFLLQTDRIK
jgi:8-oxo-dGTP pyrophosphatase MutT (NUDIX family)